MSINATAYQRITFKIRLRDFDGYSMHVEAVDTPFGRMRRPEVVPFNPELIPYLSKLGNPSTSGTMSREELITMGQMIGDMLFPTRVRRLFFQTVESHYNPVRNTGIRILLELDDEQLAVIPWEYSYIREFKHTSGLQTKDVMKGFLGLDTLISLVRFEPYADDVFEVVPESYYEGINPGEKINILFCASNPYDFSELNLANEFADITLDETIFDIQKETNVTFSGLTDLIENEKKPRHIFHFSGHAGYLSRTAVSTEGQIHSISAHNHHIDEKPSEEDLEWERRMERILGNVLPGGAAPVTGTSGDVRGIKNVIDPSRGIKNIIDPSRGIKNIIDPSRGIKNVIDPSRGIKNVIDPSRGLTSDVYETLDRKEGLLLLEQQFNTHRWQNYSFDQIEKMVQHEKENMKQARLAGIEPAKPFLDFLLFLEDFMDDMEPDEWTAQLNGEVDESESIFGTTDKETIKTRIKYHKYLLSQYQEDLRLFDKYAYLRDSVGKGYKNYADLFYNQQTKDFVQQETGEPMNARQSMEHEIFQELLEMSTRSEGSSRSLSGEGTEEIRENFKQQHKAAWNEWFLPGSVWALDSGMPHETRRNSLRWRKGSHDVLWASELSDLLKKGGKVSLVVLNSCQTSQSDSRSFEAAGVATTLIQSGIPAVIGMQLAIDDTSASKFSSVFYESLSRGEQLEAAITKGRQALAALENHQNWGIPTLYMRSLNVADEFNLGFSERIRRAGAAMPEA